MNPKAQQGSVCAKGSSDDSGSDRRSPPCSWRGARCCLSPGRRVRVLATVSHPQDVLALVGEVSPDIVLVDFATPDAVQIVAEIGRRAPDVKVVAIMLGETESEIIQLAEAGGSRYVPPHGSLEAPILP